jgi:nicotinamidase-related amidase
MLDLDPRSTALVLIDLQNGIVGMNLAPRSGQDVLATGDSLARRFRAAGALVVLVRVAFADDFSDSLRQPVDQPPQRPAGGLAAGWSEFPPGLAQRGDIHVTKRNWGGFYGTDLDVQLRRRGIRTVVLGGIATNFGVESTARQGWERGYEIVIVEDACASMSAELHDMAVRAIFPRISRVVRADGIGLIAS